MKRRLFSILAAGSLALAVAVAGLWGVSYWRAIEVYYVPSDPGCEYLAVIGHGAMVAGWSEGEWVGLGWQVYWPTPPELGMGVTGPKGYGLVTGRSRVWRVSGCRYPSGSLCSCS